MSPDSSDAIVLLSKAKEDLESDKREIFWVRMNNSTRALPEVEVEDYVRDRWRAARS